MKNSTSRWKEKASIVDKTKFIYNISFVSKNKEKIQKSGPEEWGIWKKSQHLTPNANDKHTADMVSAPAIAQH